MKTTPYFVVRPTVTEDWPAICRVHDRARVLELHRTIGLEAFVPLNLDADGSAIRRGDTLVAEVEGEVAGFIAWSGGYIGWLYVDPLYHRQGVGRALVRAALEKIGDGAWMVCLDGNDPAQRLLESEGFRMLGHFPGEIDGVPFEALRMVHRSAGVDRGTTRRRRARHVGLTGSATLH